MTDRDIVIDTHIIPELPRLRGKFVECDNLIRSLYNWKKEWRVKLRGYASDFIVLVERIVEELKEKNKCFDEKGIVLPEDLKKIQRRSGANVGDIELAKAAWSRARMKRATIILTSNTNHFPIPQFRNHGILIFGLTEFAPELT